MQHESLILTASPGGRSLLLQMRNPGLQNMPWSTVSGGKVRADALASQLPYPGSSLPHQAEAVGKETMKMQEYLRENGRNLVLSRCGRMGELGTRMLLKSPGLANGVLSWEHARRWRSRVNKAESRVWDAEWGIHVEIPRKQVWV